MAVHALPRWPLADRQHELKLIHEAVGSQKVRALLIRGPLGMGKTRLAEEAWNLAGERGFGLLHAKASHAAYSIPLGAIGHLLPHQIGNAEPAALGALLAKLHGRPGRRVALFVDDLHLLDPVSAAIIWQLVDGGEILLIGTVRSDLPAPPTMGHVEHADHVRRIGLRPLTADGVAAVLSQTLDGIVPASTALRLHAASGGIPLFLRDLVAESLGTGVLRNENQAWHLGGELRVSRRLRETIQHEVGRLPEKEGTLLKLAALCGTLEADRLPPQTLARLEHSHLVNVNQEARRTVITLRHPLYADILCAHMGLLERRELLIAEAERIRRSGMRRRADPLRVAAMHLESTGTADPQLLHQALPLALSPYDAERVATLSKALTWVDPSAGPRITLSAALLRLGKPDESLAMLHSAATRVTNDEEDDLQITRLRFWQEMFAMRFDEALAISKAGYARLAQTPIRDLLTAECGPWIAVILGDPSRALDLLADLESLTDPSARLLGSLAKAWALAEAGQAEAALSVLDWGSHQQLTVDRTGIPRCQRQVPQIIALLEAGSIPQARSLAETAYQQSVAGHELIPQVWASYCLGRAEYYAGRLEESYGWYSACAIAARTMHDRVAEWMALTGMALAAGGMGRLDLLDTALAGAEQLAPAQHRRSDGLAAAAWRLVITGNLSQARSLLLEAATRAEKSGAHAAEAHLLCDIARLGDPSRVTPRLEELASICDGDLVAAQAAQARALADRDPVGLAAAAGRLEDLGALLPAAESYSSAADLYANQGLHAKGRHASGEAQRLGSRCSGAHTPGLTLTQAKVPLTQREIEIAMLAMRRLTSEDIAEQLNISLRTVHSHLQHIYRKAGITRRRDLGRILPNATV